MKPTLIFAGPAIAVLAACQPTVVDAPAGPQRLTTMADMAPILDRRLEFGAGHTVLVSDGSLGGVVADRALTGTWEMRDGFFCRTITSGHGEAVDCQVYVLDGNTLTVTRDEGAGSVGTFLVGAPV